MKLNIFAVANIVAIALSAAVLASVGANAQTTTIIETAPPARVIETVPPAVVVEPAPSTSVQSEKTEYGLGGILGSERRTTTTTNTPVGNCQQHTTQTNTLLGSNSKTTETCY